MLFTANWICCCFLHFFSKIKIFSSNENTIPLIFAIVVSSSSICFSRQNKFNFFISVFSLWKVEEILAIFSWEIKKMFKHMLACSYVLLYSQTCVYYMHTSMKFFTIYNRNVHSISIISSDVVCIKFIWYSLWKIIKWKRAKLVFQILNST